MSDTTCHLDQLLQRTEADITILRTRPLSTDSATRSAQNVERRAVEVARSLSRIGAQLESLAKEVLAEVPNQLVSYFAARNIKPNPKKQD